MRSNQTINPAHVGEGVLVELAPGDDFRVAEKGVRAKVAFPLLAWGDDAGGTRYYWQASAPRLAVEADFGPEGGVVVGADDLKADGANLNVGVTYTDLATGQLTTYSISLLMSNYYAKPPALPKGVQIKGIRYVFVPDSDACVTVATGESVLGLVDTSTTTLFWPYSVRVNQKLQPCAEGDPSKVPAQTLYLDKLKKYDDTQTIYFGAPAILPDYRVSFVPRLLKSSGPPVDLGAKQITFLNSDSKQGYYAFTFKWGVDASTGTAYLTVKQTVNGKEVNRAVWSAHYTALLGTYGLAYVITPATVSVAGSTLDLMAYSSVPSGPPALPVSECEGGVFFVPAKLMSYTDAIVPLGDTRFSIPPTSKVITVAFVPHPSKVGRQYSVSLTLPFSVRTAKEPISLGVYVLNEDLKFFVKQGSTVIKQAPVSYYGLSLAEQGKGYYVIEGPVCPAAGASFTQPPDAPLTPPSPAPDPAGGGDEMAGLVLAGGIGVLALAYSAGWL